MISNHVKLCFLHCQLLESKTEVKKEHILSSNLSSLAAVINILKKTDNPVSVFKVNLPPI